MASALRASRKARLGHPLAAVKAATASQTQTMSKEAQDTIWAVAERKASDLAGLKITQFRKALELAYDAQSRGIVESPLHQILTSALVERNVPDAATVAADVLSGANVENLKAAVSEATRYMEMGDAEFLATKRTIQKAPLLSAHSNYVSPQPDVAAMAEAGSIPLKASGTSFSGMDHLRSVLRKTSPQPTHRIP